MVREFALSKFSEDNSTKKIVSQLFRNFLTLPGRRNPTGSKKLSVSEVFYHLKNFYAIHPLSLPKEKFCSQVLKIYERVYSRK